MRKVTCYECGRHYDFGEDGFCPRCGSFNQPRKGTYRISAAGDIVRVDGINEQGHEGSFLHEEYHREARERRRLGLDRGAAQKAKPRRGGCAAVFFVVIWLMLVLGIVVNTVFSLLFR